MNAADDAPLTADELRDAYAELRQHAARQRSAAERFEACAQRIARELARRGEALESR